MSRDPLEPPLGDSPEFPDEMVIVDEFFLRLRGSSAEASSSKHRSGVEGFTCTRDRSELIAHELVLKDPFWRDSLPKRTGAENKTQEVNPRRVANIDHRAGGCTAEDSCSSSCAKGDPIAVSLSSPATSSTAKLEHTKTRDETHDKKKLSICVLSASGLRNADACWGKSDLYCTIEMQDAKGPLAKTTMKFNTCDPQWNNSLFLEDYVPGQTIVFKVWDKDYGKVDDYLGAAKVTSNLFLKPGGSGVLELNLIKDGKGVDAVLKVKIAAQDDADGDADSLYRERAAEGGVTSDRTSATRAITSELHERSTVDTDDADRRVSSDKGDEKNEQRHREPAETPRSVDDIWVWMSNSPNVQPSRRGRGGDAALDAETSMPEMGLCDEDEGVKPSSISVSENPHLGPTGEQDVNHAEQSCENSTSHSHLDNTGMQRWQAATRQPCGPACSLLDVQLLHVEAEEEAWKFCELEAERRLRDVREQAEAIMTKTRVGEGAEELARSCLNADPDLPTLPLADAEGELIASRTRFEEELAAMRQCLEELRLETCDQGCKAKYACAAVEARSLHFESECGEHHELAEEHTARERQLEELVAYSRDEKERIQGQFDSKADQYAEEVTYCKRIQAEFIEEAAATKAHEAEAAACRLKELEALQLNARRRRRYWCMMGKPKLDAGDGELQHALEHVAQEVERQREAVKSREYEVDEENASLKSELRSVTEEETVLRDELSTVRGRLESEAASAASARTALSVAETSVGVENASSEALGLCEHGRRIVGNTIVSDVPLAVRIARFDVQGRLTAKVTYTIVIEGPGSTATVVKTSAEFRELHTALKAKPFAHALPAPPLDWMFAAFSGAFLERRRRQLETYLAALCTHAAVLCDSTIWEWLAVDHLTQIVVRLVAAHAVNDLADVSRLVQSLEVMIAAGNEADEARCVHPAVLSVFAELLRRRLPPQTEAQRDENHREVSLRARLEPLSSVCRLLLRLLPRHRRARQLLLGAPNDGIASLLASATGSAGGIVAEDAQRVLAAVLRRLVEAEDEVSASAPLRQGQSSGRTASDSAAGDGGLGDCCVCLDRGKSHALLPCGHLCACMDCAHFLAARASGCPVCRQPIERAVQIFI